MERGSLGGFSGLPELRESSSPCTSRRPRHGALVEDSATGAGLGFHASCRYSLSSPASLACAGSTCGGASVSCSHHVHVLARYCQRAARVCRTGIADADAPDRVGDLVDHVVTVAAERAGNCAIELSWTAISLSRSANLLSGKNSGSCSGWCRPLAKQPMAKAHYGLGQ